MTKEFTTLDTYKADYQLLKSEIRDGERQFADEVPFTDLMSKLDKLNRNELSGDEAQDALNQIMSHPLLQNLRGMDPGLDVRPNVNPDGSVNLEEYKLRLQNALTNANRKSYSYRPR